MMRTLRTLFLVGISILDLVQARNDILTNAKDIRGLSEISGTLGAIEAIDGGRAGGQSDWGDGQQKGAADTENRGHQKDRANTVTELVTMTVGGAGKNQTAVGGLTKNQTVVGGLTKTVTVTKTERIAAGGGIGNIQLSFVTQTIYASGAAPTVTVTPLPQMITQMVTITATAEVTAVCSGAAGAAGAAGAGNVNPAAVANAPSPASIQAPAVGTSGGMGTGTGTLLPNGACDCVCLCSPDSFPMGSMLPAPPQAAATTLQTTISTVQATASAATSVVGLSSSPSSLPPDVVAATDTPTVPGSAAVSTATLSSSTASDLAAVSQSVIQTGSPSNPTSGTTAAAAAVASAQTYNSINISALSLTSSLVLGSLAQPTING